MLLELREDNQDQHKNNGYSQAENTVHLLVLPLVTLCFCYTLDCLRYTN